MVKSLAGGLVLLVIALALGKGNTIMGIKFDMWILIVGMSIAGFGGALLLFLEGIKRIGTVKTMSMFSLTPIFGIVILADAWRIHYFISRYCYRSHYYWYNSDRPILEEALSPNVTLSTRLDGAGPIPTQVIVLRAYCVKPLSCTCTTGKT